jgi:hypothetical protein
MRFLREFERSLRIRVAELRRPSLIEIATCMTSCQCLSMSFQPMTLRPRSPNNSSMCG